MLKNELLKGKTVATPYGEVTFDDKGVSTSLSEDAQKELASKVGTYTFKADEKPKEKKSKPEEPAVEKPAPEKKPATKAKTTKK